MIDSKENNKFDLGVWGLISTGTQWHGKLTLCTEFINDNGKFRAKISLYLISSLISLCFLEIWYSMWKKKQQQQQRKKKHFDLPSKVLYHVFTDKLVDEDKFKKTTSALLPQRMSSI